MKHGIFKVFYLSLGLLFFVSGHASGQTDCEKQLSSLQKMDEAQLDQWLHQEVENYIPIAEQAFAYRSKTIRIANRLLKDIERSPDKPLSGSQLQTLKEGSAAHIALRKKLYEIAEEFECWIQDESAINGLPNQRQRLKAVMTSLSASLILYDNYLLAVSVFAQNDKLRRVLNSEDQSFHLSENRLEEMSNNYTSAVYRQRVRDAIDFYETQSTGQTKAIAADPDMGYLNQVISQSPSYNTVKQFLPLYYLRNRIRFLTRLSLDSLVELNNEGTNLLSTLFGNTVGMVEVRKGKLYGDQELEKYLQTRIKAGDILLEKTPFRLTDKLIPGHWGHVAIWVGTQEELETLGIWQHEAVVPYHQQIKDGHRIIEALRSGVEIDALSDFMNIDDLAILRVDEISKEHRKQALIRAFQQIGKAYDFNFDVETTDKIVCSELVYDVYTDIDWPTENTMGRYTISPDHIADKALSEDYIQVVYLNIDGRTIWRRPEHRLKELMATSLDR